MSALTQAVVGELSRDPRISALITHGTKFDHWIFENILPVTFQGSGTTAIVVSENSTWKPPNQFSAHVAYPLLYVDILAEPTRTAGPESGVVVLDADDRIAALAELVNDHLHLMDLSDDDGNPVVWGSDNQRASGHTLFIGGSERLTGPIYSQMTSMLGGPGGSPGLNQARQASYTFGVTLR